MEDGRLLYRQSPLALTAAGLSLGAVGVLMATNRWFVDHHLPLPDAIAATRRNVAGEQTGRLNYYVDRSAPGRPLVLIHSINAAPSAHEMLPLFDCYRSTRPVYALDLPGFGHSERAERRYTPALFASAIRDFLRHEVGEPADLIALSLGGELAARAALDVPDLVRSLTLISPSGFSRRGNALQTLAGVLPVGQTVHALMQLPLLGQGIYDFLTSRRRIEHYLRQSFVAQPPQPLVNYAYATAHQPGARHAPLAFLSGQLFTRAAQTKLYGRLRMPVLVLYDRDPYVDFEALPAFLAGRPTWRAERIAPSLGLPHWEEPAQTRRALDAFWASLPEEHRAQRLIIPRSLFARRVSVN